MVGVSDLEIILKCLLLNKRVYAFGDYKQLKPVGINKTLNTENFKRLFKIRKTFETNYRNHFTKGYYDDIIEGEVSPWSQVYKHSEDWRFAEYIICYTNRQVANYNKKKMEYLGMDLETNGCRVICKSNDLDGLMNNQIYTVEYYDDEDDEYVLNDGTYVDGKTFRKCFRPAYALTLYCIQGDSIESYHYAKEDNKYINHRSAYTLVSRLKTK